MRPPNLLLAGNALAAPAPRRHWRGRRQTARAIRLALRLAGTALLLALAGAVLALLVAIHVAGPVPAIATCGAIERLLLAGRFCDPPPPGHGAVPGVSP